MNLEQEDDRKLNELHVVENNKEKLRYRLTLISSVESTARLSSSGGGVISCSKLNSLMTHE